MTACGYVTPVRPPGLESRLRLIPGTGVCLGPRFHISIFVLQNVPHIEFKRILSWNYESQINVSIVCFHFGAGSSRTASFEPSNIRWHGSRRRAARMKRCRAHCQLLGRSYMHTPAPWSLQRIPDGFWFPACSKLIHCMFVLPNIRIHCMFVFSNIRKYFLFFGFLSIDSLGVTRVTVHPHTPPHHARNTTVANLFSVFLFPR